MTFETLINRILRYFWVPVVTVVVANLVFYPITQEKVYVTSLTLGINTNNPQFISSSQNSSEGYAMLLPELTKFLAKRFGAVDTQILLGKELGLRQEFKPETPFFTIDPLSAGQINLVFETDTYETANRFNDAVKSQYQVIVNDWNEVHETVFDINPQTDFNPQIMEVDKPLQFKILPSVVGLLLGVVALLLLPMPNKVVTDTSNSSKTK